ncbi:MAG TPA: hypothetical protein VIN75_09200, partial [Burkholderiaceae bacterium]
PPPPPPSTTTIIVLPGDSADAAIIRRKHARHASSSSTTSDWTPPPPPKDNCEKLNRDYAEATDRHDQLRGPSELTTRDQLLKKAGDDMERIRQLASASNCRLKP